MEDEFYFGFWGARGSCPAPGKDTYQYGGETTCMLLRAGAYQCLIDCGSGARIAANEYMHQFDGDLDIFFSHFHLDHICGLPFFCPKFSKDKKINLRAPILEEGFILRNAMERLMNPPIFPISVNDFTNITYSDFEIGTKLSPIPGLDIDTILLNHPGGCCGYKFSYQDQSICIIADHEHGNTEIDAKIEKFVNGTDIMVYDGMFDDDEYELFQGWGHSTWQTGVELANRANVKSLIITHHAPDQSDRNLFDFSCLARELHPNCGFAEPGKKYQPKKVLKK